MTEPTDPADRGESEVDPSGLADKGNGSASRGGPADRGDEPGPAGESDDDWLTRGSGGPVDRTRARKRLLVIAAALAVAVGGVWAVALSFDDPEIEVCSTAPDKVDPAYDTLVHLIAGAECPAPAGGRP
ncbi:hypothetical protein V5P93_006961 [Actinokineospora auranticolor]|uniref:Uncharacterized protein n=1 Tax=Actinokineospora auranticolor TaxID=155976 RepID=A0A2S6GW19_9PSEU|nr:hypothetical protein [Actinokineospora auranticolor]PPK69397.1 hypothetical protein CLV40_1033 [Actinokineospora auranticolor]